MGDTTGPGPGGVKLTPVTLTIERSGPETRRARAFEGVLAIGPGVDIVWSFDALYVMKDKGKLRTVWRVPGNEELRGFTTVIFDGNFVWATAPRQRENPYLLLLDPQSEKVWDLSAAEGLPQLPKRELAGKSITLFAAPLEAGRVCLAGSFSNRAWIAVSTFDATTECRRQGHSRGTRGKDRTDRSNGPRRPWASPSFIDLTGKPGPDAKPNRRVLVGARPRKT